MSDYVLIADGDAERGKLVAEACAARGLSASLATHGAAALEAALSERPAVLVCQLALPLIEAPRLAAILDANPRTHGVALLFLADRPGEGRGLELTGRVIDPPLDPDQVASGVQALFVDHEPAPPAGDAEEGGVEGQLSQLPLADLLELFHVSRKTGSVELTRRSATRRESGRIVLRGGDVVHAAAGEVQGVKAFFRLLGWDRGSFAFRAASGAGPVTIETATRALLREGQRQLQEWNHAGVELPPMDAQVRLKVERSALPNVIHPLTQEVLLLLELHARVSDVVDRCSHPDYQVLRTLATLADRGIIELHRDPERMRHPELDGLYTPAQVARLREWVGAGRGRGTPRDAKLLVVSSSLEATREFTRRLQVLPDVDIDARAATGAFDAGDLITLGRVTVEEDLGIELVHLPGSAELAPFWPTAGYGALAILLLLGGPVGPAVERLAPVADALRALPRARLVHLLLMGPGERIAPDAIRDNLALLEDGSLFLIPLEQTPKATALLREVFVRVLP